MQETMAIADIFAKEAMRALLCIRGMQLFPNDLHPSETPA